MGTLPQAQPSVQIGGARGGVSGSVKGQGTAALGRGIQQLAVGLTAFTQQASGAEQQALAHQLAGQQIVAVKGALASLQLNPQDSRTLLQHTQQVLQEAIAVPPDVKRQLTAEGLQTYTRILGAQIPSLANEGLAFHRQFTVTSVQQTSQLAIDQQVRDIAADVNGRDQRVSDLLAYLEGLPIEFIPDKAKRIEDTLNRMQQAIAADEAQTLPQEALRKLREPGGYSVRIQGQDVQIPLSPEARQTLTDRANASLRRLLDAEEKQETQARRNQEERSRLARVEINRAIMDGEDWRSLLGVRERMFTDGQIRELRTFGRTVEAERANGGVENPRAELEMRLAIARGEVTDPLVLLDDSRMNYTQKDRLLTKLFAEQERVATSAGTTYQQALKDGEAFIKNTLGVRLSLFSSVDAEGDQILAQLLLEFQASMAKQFDDARAAHPDEGPGFVAAVQAIDPRAAAPAFITDKAKLKGFIERRLRIRTSAVSALLSELPPEDDPTEAIKRRVADGRWTQTQANLIHLTLQRAKAKGLGVKRMISGQLTDQDRIEEAKGQLKQEEAGAYTRILTEVIRNLSGYLDPQTGGTP